MQRNYEYVLNFYKNLDVELIKKFIKIFFSGKHIFGKQTLFKLFNFKKSCAAHLLTKLYL